MNENDIYIQLSRDAEDICQIIIKNGFKDKLLNNQNYNVMLIFYHLLAIVYIKTKNSKGTKEAENIAQKLVYETLIRLPSEYEESLIENSSRIITKYMAIYRQSNNEVKEYSLNFSLQLSKGICEIFANDSLYFIKEEYKMLISKLKKYFDVKMEDYNRLF